MADVEHRHAVAPASCVQREMGARVRDGEEVVEVALVDRNRNDVPHRDLALSSHPQRTRDHAARSRTVGSERQVAGRAGADHDGVATVRSALNQQWRRDQIQVVANGDCVVASARVDGCCRSGRDTLDMQKVAAGARRTQRQIEEFQPAKLQAAELVDRRLIRMAHAQTRQPRRGEDPQVGRRVTLIEDVERVDAGIAVDFDETSDVVDRVQRLVADVDGVVPAVGAKRRPGEIVGAVDSHGVVAGAERNLQVTRRSTRAVDGQCVVPGAQSDFQMVDAGVLDAGAAESGEFGTGKPARVGHWIARVIQDQVIGTNACVDDQQVAQVIQHAAGVRGGRITANANEIVAVPGADGCRTATDIRDVHFVRTRSRFDEHGAGDNVTRQVDHHSNQRVVIQVSRFDGDWPAGRDNTAAHGRDVVAGEQFDRAGRRRDNGGRAQREILTRAGTGHF